MRPRATTAETETKRGARGALFAWCCLALAFGAGCQVYDPSLLERDAGAGACGVPATPPARPSADQDGDDGEEYIYALRSVVLDQAGGEWMDIGFDLDGRCTQTPDFDTECRPPMRSRPPNDGNGGIDNVFGAELFPLVDVTIRAQGMGSLQETARRAQDEGKAPALRLRGWNGTDDDASVDVTITNSIFAVPADAGGEPPAFDVEAFVPVDPTTRERLPLPVWDGTDYGYFRIDTFFEGDPEVPLIRDDNAYVSGGVVVARLPERFEILFPAEDLGVLVRLTDATAVGRISADRQTIEDVVVGGRWRLLDLLATAENVGVCRDSDSYGILVGQLNAIADIRATPGTGGEGVLCDAISLGVGFTGTRLRWGGLVEGPSVRNVCEEMPLPDGGAQADAGGSPDAGPPDAGPRDAGSAVDGG